MTIHLTEPQSLAVRKHALKALRSLGIKNPNDFEPHKLSWADLNARAKLLHKAASDLVDKFTDDLDEEQSRSIEDACDGLIAIIDAINSEKDERTKIGNRGPRKHSHGSRVPLGGDVTWRGDGFEDRRDVETGDSRLAFTRAHG